MANNFAVGLVIFPPNFDIQSQNPVAEWKFWRPTFEDCLADPVTLSILTNMIGVDSARIMSTFAISGGEANKYKYIMELIEK